MDKDVYFFQVGIRLFRLWIYYIGVSISTISAYNSNNGNRDNFHSQSLISEVSISTLLLRSSVQAWSCISHMFLGYIESNYGSGRAK